MDPRKNTSEHYTTPIKVRVTLKREQYTGELNNWACTVDGVKRIVPMRDVEWYAVSAEAAAKSFVESEVESFTITGNSPRNH
jgi:hypothetical protein